jgi:hypothetical protein
MVRHCIPEIPNVPIPRCSVFCCHFWRVPTIDQSMHALLSLSLHGHYIKDTEQSSPSLSVSLHWGEERQHAPFLLSLRGGKKDHCSSLFAIVNNPFAPTPIPPKKGNAESLSSLSPLSLSSSLRPSRVVIMHSLDQSLPRPCMAVGVLVINLHLLAEAGLLDNLDTVDNDNFHPRINFSMPSLDRFLGRTQRMWIAMRILLVSLFLLGNGVGDCRGCGGGGGGTMAMLTMNTTVTTNAIVDNDRLWNNVPLRNAALVPMSYAVHHLPCAIGDYTDFYLSWGHATNVGTMFRGKDDAPQPHWLHVPIGYHGRSSSINVLATLLLSLMCVPPQYGPDTTYVRSGHDQPRQSGGGGAPTGQRGHSTLSRRWHLWLAGQQTSNGSNMAATVAAAAGAA